MIAEDSRTVAETLIGSLPSDEESPDRALAFQALVLESCHSHERTEILLAVYRMAASGAWASSLHDSNMLLYALPLNPDMTARAVDSVERILGWLPRAQAKGFLAWLGRNCPSVRLDELAQRVLA